MKMTEKSAQVFNYVKNAEGKVSTDELMTAMDRNSRSITATVNDLVKKGLAVREKVAGEGEDAKDITYVVLTDLGLETTPTEE